MISGVLGARAVILVAFAVSLVVAVVGASRLTIDPNNRVFFATEHPHFRNLIDLEAAFGSNTNLVFVIRGSQPLFADPSLLEAIRWLTAEAWSIERVVSVDSVANAPIVDEIDDELLVTDLLAYVCGQAIDGSCSHEREWRLNSSIVLNRLADESRRVFSVIAGVDLHSATSTTISLVAEQADEIRLKFNQMFPNHELFLTGAVPMMQAFIDAAEHDVSTLLATAVVVLSVGLFLFLGSLIATSLLVLVGISSVLFTLGVAGYLGMTLNTATATVPLIVFTLVVASAMHVFLHLVREPSLASRQGVQAAIRVSVSANWIPVGLTVITTAVGLLSLVFVASPPMKELGVLSSVGVLFGGLVTLVVAPCVLSYLSRLRTSRLLLLVQGAMNRYAKWLERSRPNQAWMLVLFALALGGLYKLSVDEDFVRYFSPASAFRMDTESITALLSGPYHIDVVFDSGDQAGIFEQASLRSMNDLVVRIRDLPGVVSVISVFDVLGEARFAFEGDRDLLGSSAEELAQYFLTYELSLDAGHSSHELLDSDQRRGRISILLGDVSMSGIRAIEQDIAQLGGALGIGNRITVTGEGVPTAYLSSESIREMSLGIALSVLFSAMLVGLCFKSPVVSGTILLATGIPLLSAFGVWGWLDSEIGMAAVLVVATTIGVVMDDTIHLTYRYIDGLRSHELTSWGAAAYSVHKAGTAIAINSVVLASGLLVLATSGFRMNSTFGFCAFLVILIALAYSLGLAPRLLTLIKGA